MLSPRTVLNGGERNIQADSLRLFLGDGSELVWNCIGSELVFGLEFGFRLISLKKIASYL